MTRILSLGGWIWVFGVLTGCSTIRPSHLTRFEFQRPEMGLPFRLVLYAPTPEAATNAFEAAFARIADLNGCLSDYDETSELSKLSRSSGSGNSVPISEDLWRVLDRATVVSRCSDGAFDITVGPLVQLWKRARRQRELPSEERLSEARSKVNWQAIELDRPVASVSANRATPHSARLTLSGMRLDPGGIAKGYALGEAAKVIRTKGLKCFLISGGGDMVAGQPPPGKTAWRIKIGAFDTVNAPSARYISLREQSLCTSGDQFQRVEINGVRYSHIVDPRTGHAITDHSLVTMIGPDPMTTDALSKVVSVLGPTEGLARIRQFPGVECLVFRQPRETVEVTESPGLHRWLESPSTENNGEP